PEVVAHRPWNALAGSAPHRAALETVSVDLTMAAAVEDAELVHSHTWYANLAGHLAKLMYGIPHVATVHSLEPMRPWKAEQLGGGYAVSTFCEQTALENADAVIAVTHLLDAALRIDAGAQLVLCAGAPDTPEIAAEIESKVARLRAERGNVVWLEQMLPKPDVIQLLSHATVFVCPSIYEPLGIVNL